MKRALDGTRTPPPSKRRKRQLEAREDEDNSEMEEDIPVEADRSQYFSPSQVHSQEEKYAATKSNTVLVK